MSDFDGIDRGTFSRLAVTNEPITAETLRQAVEAIESAAPVTPCGTEENPHRYFGDVRVGERVRCVVCAERLIALPDGRAMIEPALADFFKRGPLRFAAPPLDDSKVTVPPEYRYMSVPDARVGHTFVPMSIGYDWGFEPPRRWRPRNLTRSTSRTDFGRRFR